MAETKVKPFINIGPGRFIRRAMNSLDWSQKDLTEILGMSSKSISQIINNKQAITIDIAVLLGKAFDTSQEFWMNLEQNYRLRLGSRPCFYEATGKATIHDKERYFSPGEPFGECTALND